MTRMEHVPPMKLANFRHALQYAPLTRSERRLLLAACAAACVLGVIGGYWAYMDVEEHYFHGGILKEDAAHAIWHPFRAAGMAFVQLASVAFLFLGGVLIGLRRFMRKSRI